MTTYKFKIGQRATVLTPEGKESVTIKGRFLVNYGTNLIPNKNPIYFVWFDESFNHPKYIQRIAGATYVEGLLTPEVV